MIQAIQELLNSAGRAIIPGVGCLSINDENKIIFNPFLKFNDGKLSAKIMELEGIGENESQKKLSAWTREIEQTLMQGHDFDLGALGRFFLEGKDEIGFSTESKISASSSRQEEPSQQEPNESLQPEPVTVHAHTIDQTPQTAETPQSEEQIELAKDINSNPVEAEEHTITPTEEQLELEQKEETTSKKASLDDLLNARAVYPTQENSENTPESIEVIDNEPIVETSSAITHENIAQSLEEVKSEVGETLADKNAQSVQNSSENVDNASGKPKKSKKHENPEVQGEEIIIKRKRSKIFYVNIFLFFLIIVLGTFAFLYTDEVSEWLGISAPTTEVPRDTVLQEEAEIEDVTPEPAENLPETEELPEVAPVPPKIEVLPTPEPMPSNIPAVASSGDFHIIVGKFAVKENADRLVQKIRDSGYDGKILRSTATGHTVSFHSYPSMEEATNNLNKAKEITGTGAYIEKK